MTYEPLNPRDDAMQKKLERVANSIQPNPIFAAELESKLKAAHKPKRGFALPSFRNFLPTLGWTVALATLALLFYWGIRNLAPIPPQPAGVGTPTLVPTPKPIAVQATVNQPDGKAYDRHGMTVYLQTELPSLPAEAAVYNYQTDRHATLEDARALAARFGMNGAIYKVNGETATLPLERDFLVVDGNQRLHVRSDQYFQYYPDYPRYVAAINNSAPPANAEALIDEFMQSHGFDFAYEIHPSPLYGGYIAAPLTPDGNIICYEHFKCAGLRFQLDAQGILSVDAALPKYETLGQYGIISAETAFQLFLHPENMSDPARTTGVIEGMISPSAPIQTWLRPRPLDATITLYGYLNSVRSAEGGAPFVTLDGYTVTGNTADIPAQFDNTFVAATGQFHEANGVRTFELESWKVYAGNEDGLLGAISLQNGQVILNTMDDEILVLPDASDLPLPLDSVFVVGVRLGDTFDWKSIDLRNVQGGGGGGGGGLGFYKLNLTGAPVPFPTPAPMGGGGGGGESSTYTVVAGDTCLSIAYKLGVSVDELLAANDLPADCSTLTIDQTLIIPASASSLPQKVEGMRGYLSITIYKQADGSQRVDYGFINDNAVYPSLPLEGENLEALQAYQGRPVDVWGSIESQEGQVVLKVERYEIPFPGLQFQILRGKQTPVTLNGQPATLFTADDGKTYVQFNPGGGVDGSTVGNLGDEVLIEGLIVPDESFGGYPAVRVFSAATAINPDNGEAQELQISADQVYVVDEATEGPYTPPTLAIQRVELVYYMPDPRYHVGDFEPDQLYLQPAWMFTGHYSDGTAFYILVQALQQQYLLPERAPYTQPG